MFDRRSTPCPWAVALTLILVGPLSAQERPDEVSPGMAGTVVDGTTGVGLPGALIVVEGGDHRRLTDSLGVFSIGGIEAGTYDVSVRAYGYEPTPFVVRLRGGESLRFPLEPRPEVLEGLLVIAERLPAIERQLRNRRRAVPFAVRAFDQDRLVRSPAWDMREFLRQEAHLFPTTCDRMDIGTSCVVRRGRVIQPRVYIDEARLVGGLLQLETYRPHELYLVEVYSSGNEIRAYTHQFVERMARTPQALIPIIW